MANRITNIAAIATGKDLTFSGTMRGIREELARTRAAAEATAAGTSKLNIFGGLLPTFDVGGAFSFIATQVGDAVRAIDMSLGRIEQRKDAAETIGFTYEQMQALTVASKLANVEVETLTGAFGRMFKTVVQAAEGNKQATEELQRLGLTIQQIEGKSSFEVLRMVADSLAGIESPAERARAAMDLFGREVGLKMTRVLEGGGASIDGYIAKARELGMVLSDEVVDSVKRTQDAIDLVTLRTQAAQDRMAADAKSFLEVWQKIRATTVEGLASVSSFVQDAAIVTLDAGAKVAEVLDARGSGKSGLSGGMSPSQIIDLRASQMSTLANVGGGAEPPALIGGVDEAMKFQEVLRTIDEEQIKNAAETAKWMREARVRELENYYRQEAEHLKRSEKMNADTTERILRDQKDAMAERERAMAAARSEFDANAGRGAPNVGRGSAADQVLQYQSGRAEAMAKTRDDYLASRVQQIMNQTTFKVTGTGFTIATGGI